MQAQQPEITQHQKQQKSIPSWTRWVLVLIAVLLIAAGTILGIIQGNFTGPLFLILNALGVILALLQWLIPVSSGTSPSATTTSLIHPPPASLPTAMTYQGVLGLPPPTDPSTIQQRGHVVSEIYKKLTQPGTTAIALTGIGGVGKSTLAALVYRYAEEQRRVGYGLFQEEALWLTVNEGGTMADLAGTLFEALGKRLPDFHGLSAHSQARALFNALNTVDKPRLVILDQFENLLDWQTGRASADRPGVGEWLDAINSHPCACRILLTSRPLPKGARASHPTHMHEYHITGLEVDEGKALLKQRRVAATEAELGAAVEQCGGHPFALTLLVSLLHTHQLRLGTVLADPIYAEFWTGNIADNLLDYIYNRQLSDLQRALLRAFCFYREPVPLQATQAVMDMETEIPRAQLLPALESLCTQHLLQAAGEGCYQLHAIVAGYTQGHVYEESERVNQQLKQAAHVKAAQYYVQQAALNCPPRNRRRQFSDIHPLIEAAWQWCHAERWREAFDLMEQEGFFVDLRRWGGNAILLELCRLLLPPSKWHANPRQTARLYSSLGEVYRVLGQMKPAQEYLEQALQLCRDTGNRLEEGWILTSLGRVSYELALEDQAGEYYEQALQIQRAVGDRAGEAMTLNYLGRVYERLEQIGRGKECYQEALQIYKELGDQRGEGWTLWSLGNIYNAWVPSQAEKEQALHSCQDALRILREVGDREREGWAHTYLGRVYDALGQHEQAREHYEEALSIHREVGSRRGEGWTYYNLGKSLADSGQYERAQECFEQALSIQREVKDRWNQGVTLNQMGWLSQYQGKIERAHEYLEESLQLRSEVGDQLGRGRTLKNLARVYMRLWEKEPKEEYLEQAYKCLEKALRINKEMRDRDGEARTLQALGVLALLQQHQEVALASFLRAQQICEELESSISKEIQDQLQDLHEKMGEAAYSSLVESTEPQVDHIIAKALNAAS